MDLEAHFVDSLPPDVLSELRLAAERGTGLYLRLRPGDDGLLRVDLWRGTPEAAQTSATGYGRPGETVVAEDFLAGYYNGEESAETVAFIAEDLFLVPTFWETDRGLDLVEVWVGEDNFVGPPAGFNCRCSVTGRL